MSFLRSSTLGWACLVLPCFLAGCGAAPERAPVPIRDLDVFHDVYLRGAPSAQSGRVALTFSGLTACTPAILGALRAPEPGAKPLRTTVFLRPQSITEAREADPKATKATLERLAAEDHLIALSATVDGAAGENRRELTAASEALRAQLKQDSVQSALAPRIWRPELDNVDLKTVGNLAHNDRPAVLWSLRAEPGRELEILDRLADGDIVVLPGGGAGCPAVELVPRLSRALKAAKLEAVSVPELLSAQLSRHAPARLARYHGEGLSAACAETLGVSADAAPSVGAHWGLVESEDGPFVRFLPLPLKGRTVDVVTHLAQVRSLWARRSTWLGQQACLKTVRRDRLLSPLTAERDQGRIDWHTAAGDARDARATVASGKALVVPTIHDLTRIEATQRLPWVTRGLVGGALELLGLETAALLEAHGAVRLVIAQKLTPEDAPRLERSAEVVAGYALVTEVSAVEYLVLAHRFPQAAQALNRAARASDGFLQAGPYLVLPAVAGGAPDAMRLAVDGELAFPEGALAAIRSVLRAGHSLNPGDIVSVSPAGRVEPPQTNGRSEVARSFRSATRHALASIVKLGLRRSSYLRPGSVVSVEGDLLGRQRTRVASPPGIAVPTQTIVPLVDQTPSGSTP